MKKLKLTILTLLILSLASCGGNEPQTKNPKIDVDDGSYSITISALTDSANAPLTGKIHLMQNNSAISSKEVNTAITSVAFNDISGDYTLCVGITNADTCEFYYDGSDKLNKDSSSAKTINSAINTALTLPEAYTFNVDLQTTDTGIAEFMFLKDKDTNPITIYKDVKKQDSIGNIKYTASFIRNYADSNRYLVVLKPFVTSSQFFIRAYSVKDNAIVAIGEYELKGAERFQFMRIYGAILSGSELSDEQKSQLEQIKTDIKNFVIDSVTPNLSTKADAIDLSTTGNLEYENLDI